MTEKSSNSTLLLVDFENVQKLDLASLPPGIRVRVFVGKLQKAVPFDMVRQAQPLGDRLGWVRSDGVGRNALDFLIAFDLGVQSVREPDTEYILLSKDQGFDALMDHMRALGIRCRRINSQLELGASKPQAGTSDLARVQEVLARSSKARRPRKRSTLAPHIANILKKPAVDREVEEIIDLMFLNGLISEHGGSLSYHF